MKKLSLLFLPLMLAACGQSNLPLDQYAESVTTFQPSTPTQFTGIVAFTHGVPTPSTKQVCDQVACGTQLEDVCKYVDQCNEVTPPQVCTVVNRVRRCTQPPPQNVCNVVKVCNWQTVTKYCDVNCKTVPTTVIVDHEVDSVVTLNIVGAGSAANDIQVVMGSRMTDDFRQAYSDTWSRPSGTGGIFDQLSATDNSVLVLQSKQYQLVRDQNFFSLPTGFQPGDPIQLTVQVQANDGSSPYSAVGSASQVPSLYY